MKFVRVENAPVWSRLAAFLCVLTLQTGAFAQLPALPTLADVPEAIAKLQPQREQLDRRTDLADPARQVLRQAYDDVLRYLQQAQGLGEQINQYNALIEKAPATLKELDDALSKPAAEAQPKVSEDTPLTTLLQQLFDAESALADAQAAQGAATAESQQRAERWKQLPQLLSEARRRLEEARRQTPAPPMPGEPEELAPLRQLSLQAQRVAIETEIGAYQKERFAYDIRGQVLKQQEELANRTVQDCQDSVSACQEAVNTRRRQEANQQAADARAAVLAAAHADEQVKAGIEKLANVNASLINLRTGPDGLLKKIEQCEQEKSTLQEATTQIKADLDSFNAKVGRGGLNSAMGLLLQRQRANLPDLGVHRRKIRARQNTIADVELEQINLQAQDRSDDERQVGDLLMRSGAKEGSEAKALEDLARRLVKTQKECLRALTEDYDRYSKALTETDDAERDLVDIVSQFEQYIDKRILWIRNAPSLRTQDLWEAMSEAQALIDPQHWIGVAQSLRAEVVANPVNNGWPAVAFLLCLVLYRRVRMRLEELGRLASKNSCTVYSYTATAAPYTILLAMLLPAFIWFPGWRLATSLNTTADFARAFGIGLQSAAMLLLPASLLWQIMRPHGLGEAHFAWPSRLLAQFRTHLLWANAVVAPALLILATLQFQDREAWRPSLERFLFLLIVATSLVFLHYLLRPKGGLAIELLESQVLAQKVHRRAVWYALGLSVPVVLGVLAAAGYYFTALHLGLRVFATLCLTVACLIATALVMRWSLLVRRRVAMEQGRRRRAVEKERDGAETSASPEEEDKWLDLARIDLQTQRLIRGFIGFGLLIGLWFIWSRELPALSVLNDHPLWKEGSITWGGLFLAGLVGVMTLVASNNIPGLLEMAILQRLQLGSGERYAIRTLVRYAIALAGVVVAGAYLGITWSSVQWLVAALGVGLGFGLQEIFANFVSGLIILFERPIRVGDTVTIGGISGIVSRIRFRATTITDFDRKELIVPNKSFITGDLVNWTLSDPILRLVVPIGIAYGSDTEKAFRLLHEIAEQHPKVLKDPKPDVIFMGFGESSLDFELRVYSPDFESYLPLRHDMHMAIDKAFREHHIEIAFPQRDVHVRTIQEFLPDREGVQPESK